MGFVKLCCDGTPDLEKAIRVLEGSYKNFVLRHNGELVTVTDILALLKAQKPQVMSIGDLYGYDMGFYERRDEELIWPVLISRGGPDDDETVGFVRKDGYELRSDCGLMNITWRIWTAYPPHELREATPWQ